MSSIVLSFKVKRALGINLTKIIIVQSSLLVLIQVSQRLRRRSVKEAAEIAWKALNYNREDSCLASQTITLKRNPQMEKSQIH